MYILCRWKDEKGILSIQDEITLLQCIQAPNLVWGAFPDACGNLRWTIQGDFTSAIGYCHAESYDATFLSSHWSISNWNVEEAEKQPEKASVNWVSKTW